MQRRKDNKGRVLKDGEVYRKSDGLYMYRWTAKNGKRHTIYDATLEGLREKEEKIQHDLADGIRIPECSLTLNDLFELWRKNKVGLKEHTFANYVYMYNRFVRDEIGMMKLKDIRKSDIRSYYNGIVRNGKMALNTLETIQNILHQVFAVAVDDEYIRNRRNLGLRIPEPLWPAAEPADGQPRHQAHQRGTQRSRAGKGRKGKTGAAAAAALLLP